MLVLMIKFIVLPFVAWLILLRSVFRVFFGYVNSLCGLVVATCVAADASGMVYFAGGVGACDNGPSMSIQHPGLGALDFLLSRCCLRPRHARLVRCICSAVGTLILLILC